MAGNKTALKAKIKATYEIVSTYDGTEGKGKDEAIEFISNELTNAIDDYVKSLTIISTPLDVSESVMLAGQIPVFSTNNLNSKIVDI